MENSLEKSITSLDKTLDLIQTQFFLKQINFHSFLAKFDLIIKKIQKSDEQNNYIKNIVAENSETFKLMFNGNFILKLDPYLLEYKISYNHIREISINYDDISLYPSSFNKLSSLFNTDNVDSIVIELTEKLNKLLKEKFNLE